MSPITIEPELNSLKSKLTAEIENDSRQVEALKKKITKNEELLRAVKASLGLLHPEGDNSEYGAKSDIVWGAINRLIMPQFTQSHVESEIKRANPETVIDHNRIRAVLWAFANKSGKLNIVRKGSTLSPALYEKSTGAMHQKRVTQNNSNLPNNNGLEQEYEKTPSQITPAMLEDSVRDKGVRIDKLAKQLKTDEATIRSLLEPASRVYVAVGGYLRVR